MLAALDAREAELRKKHRQTGPLAQVAREREGVLAVRRELQDLSLLLELRERETA